MNPLSLTYDEREAIIDLQWGRNQELQHKRNVAVAGFLEEVQQLLPKGRYWIELEPGVMPHVEPLANREDIKRVEEICRNCFWSNRCSYHQGGPSTMSEGILQKRGERLNPDGTWDPDSPCRFFPSRWRPGDEHLVVPAVPYTDDERPGPVVPEDGSADA